MCELQGIDVIFTETVHIYRNTANAFEDWLRIMRHLNPFCSYHSNMLIDEIWGKARTYEEMPHFGNIAQGIILGEIKRWLENCRPDWTVTYTVDARSSTLTINGQNITDYRQFVRMFDNAEAA